MGVSLPHHNMPDIVPIVRRPVVRRANNQANTDKTELGSAQPRKLSIGGENNNTEVKVRRGWVPPKDRKSPPKEKKAARPCEEPLPPPPKTPTYNFPEFLTSKSSPPKSTAVPPSLPVSKTRAVKTSKDLELEHKVLQWIMTIVHEKPTTDYDRFIQDGSVLSKVMTSIVFNSVPLEQVDDNWGVNPAMDRVKVVIREIRRYGVVDVFEPEGLIELKNIPKVTKCLAQLSKLAASDKDSLLSTTVS